MFCLTVDRKSSIMVSVGVVCVLGDKWGGWKIQVSFNVIHSSVNMSSETISR